MADLKKSTDTRGMPGGKLAWGAVGAFVVVIVVAAVWGLVETSDIDATPHEGRDPSVLQWDSDNSPFPAPSPAEADDGRGNPNNPTLTQE